MLKRVALTGRSLAGKDWLFEQAGIITADSLSAPMIRFVEFSLGIPNIKSVPGGRKLLQQVGEWGRGYGSADYPVSAERMLMLDLLRRTMVSAPTSSGLSDLDPLALGRSNFWLSRFENPPEFCYVTGIRFEEEVKFFYERGFDVYHVVTSSVERVARARQLDDLRPDSSELFAGMLDEKFRHGNIADLPWGVAPKAIWNSASPLPNDHFFTVEEFTGILNKYENTQ